MTDKTKSNAELNSAQPPKFDPTATLESMLIDFEEMYGDQLKEMLWELICRAFSYGHHVASKGLDADGKSQ